MNYDQHITDLAEAIKADKSIIQPWRNKAVARIEECQAFVKMGLTTTNYKTPIGYDVVKPECTCPFPGRDKDCPTHGDGV